MNKWSGKQNNGNHPIRTADRRQMKENESSTHHLWNNKKHAYIHVIGILEGEETEKGAENVF